MSAITCLFRVSALLAGGVLLYACSDDDSPTPVLPDPTPTAQLSRYFSFATATPGGGTAHSGYGVSHPPQDVTGEARLNAAAKVLVLDFKTKPDEVHFEIDQQQLQSKWTGPYTLRCRARPADPVFVSYVYAHQEGGFSVLRLSDFTTQLSGHVTITTYDAKRKLISGSFEVEAPDQRDPTKGITFENDKCTITLAGEFTDLKVQ